MCTICSVLRTVANYLMWRDMHGHVMSVILLYSDDWLTSAIWVVQSILRDLHPNFILVLSCLFVRHWCLLPCAPSCGIHCTDILLVPNGVFSTPLQWILWEGHTTHDVGCLMFFLVTRIEKASSCDEFLRGDLLQNHPCWCYPVASNAKIVADMHGSVASGNACPWLWSFVGQWYCW